MWKVGPNVITAFGAILLCLPWESVAQNTTNPVNGSITEVATTRELRSALRNAVKGSVIELKEGVFTGPFVLRKDAVTVRGQGAESIILLKASGTEYAPKFALDISGNNCDVNNLKMVSRSEHTLGIKITGSGNRFSNISIAKYAAGFRTHGNRNILNNIKLKDIRGGYAVVFVGSNNSVTSLDCDKCTRGIYVDGDHNSMQHVQMRYNTNPSDYYGIIIESGIGNSVDFYMGGEDLLALWTPSSNAMVRDVVCGRMLVGGRGHILVSVDAGRLLEVHGSGHRIAKTKAAKLDNQSTNVTFIQSSFQPEGRL